MRDILDTHSHTLASGHAYSTIRENAHMAAKRGLELLAITEHAPCMPGSCHDFYFHNLKVVDRNAYEVPLLLGVELNILDTRGNVDLDLHTLKQLDDGRFPIDCLALVQAAKEYGKLLELNNSSLRPMSTRKGAREQDLEILKLCEQYQVSIVIGSDAHVDTEVGGHDLALALLEEAGFPEFLVVNGDVERLKPYANAYKATEEGFVFCPAGGVGMGGCDRW